LHKLAAVKKPAMFGAKCNKKKQDEMSSDKRKKETKKQEETREYMGSKNRREC
jgi:hypothetical protein